LKGSLIAPVLMTSKSVTGSPYLCFDKRHCLSVSQNCVETFATGSPLHFWR